MTTCPRCGRDEARPTFDNFCDDCWVFIREGNKLSAASPYSDSHERELRREAKIKRQQKGGE